MTYLADAFEDSNYHNGGEVSEADEDGRQDGQRGRPENSEQQQALAAEPLRQHAAGDLRCHVAVEERR